MGALAREPLPGADDSERLVAEVVGVVWVRKVAGHSLWLAYRFNEAELWLVALKRREPRGFD